MFFLSIIHFPLLIINVYQSNNNTRSLTAATFTIANLGSATAVTTANLPICDETQNLENCQIG